MKKREAVKLLQKEMINLEYTMSYERYANFCEAIEVVCRAPRRQLPTKLLHRREETKE